MVHVFGASFHHVAQLIVCPEIAVVQSSAWYKFVSCTIINSSAAWPGTRIRLFITPLYSKISLVPVAFCVCARTARWSLYSSVCARAARCSLESSVCARTARWSFYSSVCARSARWSLCSSVCGVVLLTFWISKMAHLRDPR